ncbi:hypothetical protein PENTCL1PPCAC_14856, partial [Pristionchus entomophagus]
MSGNPPKGSSAVHLIVTTSERWRPILIKFAKRWNVSIDNLPGVDIPINDTLLEYQKQEWQSTQLSNFTMDISNTMMIMRMCPVPKGISEDEFLMRAYY